MLQALSSAVASTARCIVPSLLTRISVGTNGSSRDRVSACSVDSDDGNDLALCDSNSGGDTSAHGTLVHGSGRKHRDTSRDSRDDRPVVLGSDDRLNGEGG